MMASAERHGELITDFATKCQWLRVSDEHLPGGGRRLDTAAWQPI